MDKVWAAPANLEDIETIDVVPGAMVQASFTPHGTSCTFPSLELAKTAAEALGALDRIVEISDTPMPKGDWLVRTRIC